MRVRAKRRSNRGLDIFLNSARTLPRALKNGSRLLADVEPGEYVYFTHSYRGPVTSDTAAITHYIEPFAAAVERDNVMGVQFHPEKSGATGLKILCNFLSWSAEGSK
jgi:imidazoleglycerol phosphate synthase glutamine amidotransferase subunit HisH